MVLEKGGFTESPDNNSDDQFLPWVLTTKLAKGVEGGDATQGNFRGRKSCDVVLARSTSIELLEVSETGVPITLCIQQVHATIVCLKKLSWSSEGKEGGRDLLLLLSDSGMLSVLLFATSLNRFVSVQQLTMAPPGIAPTSLIHQLAVCPRGRAVAVCAAHESICLIPCPLAHHPQRITLIEAAAAQLDPPQLTVLSPTHAFYRCSPPLPEPAPPALPHVAATCSVLGLDFVEADCERATGSSSTSSDGCNMGDGSNFGGGGRSESGGSGEGGHGERLQFVQCAAGGGTAAPLLLAAVLHRHGRRDSEVVLFWWHPSHPHSLTPRASLSLSHTSALGIPVGVQTMPFNPRGVVVVGTTSLLLLDAPTVLERVARIAAAHAQQPQAPIAAVEPTAATDMATATTADDAPLFTNSPEPTSSISTSPPRDPLPDTARLSPPCSHAAAMHAPIMVTLSELGLGPQTQVAELGRLLEPHGAGGAWGAHDDVNHGGHGGAHAHGAMRGQEEDQGGAHPTLHQLRHENYGHRALLGFYQQHHLVLKTAWLPDPSLAQSGAAEDSSRSIGGGGGGRGSGACSGASGVLLVASSDGHLLACTVEIPTGIPAQGAPARSLAAPPSRQLPELRVTCNRLRPPAHGIRPPNMMLGLVAGGKGYVVYVEEQGDVLVLDAPTLHCHAPTTPPHPPAPTAPLSPAPPPPAAPAAAAAGAGGSGRDTPLELRVVARMQQVGPLSGCLEAGEDQDQGQGSTSTSISSRGSMSSNTTTAPLTRGLFTLTTRVQGGGLLPAPGGALESGTARSSVDKVAAGVLAAPVAQFPAGSLPPTTGLWPLHSSPSHAHHSLLVASFLGASRVLTLGNTLSDVSDELGLCVEEETVAAGVGHDRVMVQVTPSAVWLRSLEGVGAAVEVGGGVEDGGAAGELPSSGRGDGGRGGTASRRGWEEAGRKLDSNGEGGWPEDGAWAWRAPKNRRQGEAAAAVGGGAHSRRASAVAAEAGCGGLVAPRAWSWSGGMSRAHGAEHPHGAHGVSAEADGMANPTGPGSGPEPRQPLHHHLQGPAQGQVGHSLVHDSQPWLPRPYGTQAGCPQAPRSLSSRSTPDREILQAGSQAARHQPHLLGGPSAALGGRGLSSAPARRGTPHTQARQRRLSGRAGGAAAAADAFCDATASPVRAALQELRVHSATTTATTATTTTTATAATTTTPSSREADGAGHTHSRQGRCTGDVSMAVDEAPAGEDTLSGPAADHTATGVAAVHTATPSNGAHTRLTPVTLATASTTSPPQQAPGGGAAAPMSDQEAGAGVSSLSQRMQSDMGEVGVWRVPQSQGRGPRNPDQDSDGAGGQSRHSGGRMGLRVVSCVTGGADQHRITTAAVAPGCVVAAVSKQAELQVLAVVRTPHSVFVGTGTGRTGQQGHTGRQAPFSGRKRGRAVWHMAAAGVVPIQAEVSCVEVQPAPVSMLPPDSPPGSRAYWLLVGDRSPSVTLSLLILDRHGMLLSHSRVACAVLPGRMEGVGDDEEAQEGPGMRAIPHSVLLCGGCRGPVPAMPFVHPDAHGGGGGGDGGSCGGDSGVTNAMPIHTKASDACAPTLTLTQQLLTNNAPTTLLTHPVHTVQWMMGYRQGSAALFEVDVQAGGWGAVGGSGGEGVGLEGASQRVAAGLQGATHTTPPARLLWHRRLGDRPVSLSCLGPHTANTSQGSNSSRGGACATPAAVAPAPAPSDPTPPVWSPVLAVLVGSTAGILKVSSFNSRVWWQTLDVGKAGVGQACGLVMPPTTTSTSGTSGQGAAQVPGSFPPSPTASGSPPHSPPSRSSNDGSDGGSGSSGDGRGRGVRDRCAAQPLVLAAHLDTSWSMSAVKFAPGLPPGPTQPFITPVFPPPQEPAISTASGVLKHLLIHPTTHHLIASLIEAQPGHTVSHTHTPPSCALVAVCPRTWMCVASLALGDEVSIACAGVWSVPAALCRVAASVRDGEGGDVTMRGAGAAGSSGGEGVSEETRVGGGGSDMYGGEGDHAGRMGATSYHGVEAEAAGSQTRNGDQGGLSAPPQAQQQQQQQEQEDAVVEGMEWEGAGGGEIVAHRPQATSDTQHPSTSHLQPPIEIEAAYEAQGETKTQPGVATCPLVVLGTSVVSAQQQITGNTQPQGCLGMLHVLRLRPVPLCPSPPSAEQGGGCQGAGRGHSRSRSRSRRGTGASGSADADGDADACPAFEGAEIVVWDIIASAQLPAAVGAVCGLRPTVLAASVGTRLVTFRLQPHRHHGRRGFKLVKDSWVSTRNPITLLATCQLPMGRPHDLVAAADGTCTVALYKYCSDPGEGLKALQVIAADTVPRPVTSLVLLPPPPPTAPSPTPPPGDVATVPPTKDAAMGDGMRHEGGGERAMGLAHVREHGRHLPAVPTHPGKLVSGVVMVVGDAAGCISFLRLDPNPLYPMCNLQTAAMLHMHDVCVGMHAVPQALVPDRVSPVWPAGCHLGGWGTAAEDAGARGPGFNSHQAHTATLRTRSSWQPHPGECAKSLHRPHIPQLRLSGASGAVYSLVPAPSAPVAALLSKLEHRLAALPATSSLSGSNHSRYRGTLHLHHMALYTPPERRNVLDGDLLATFLELPRALQLRVARELVQEEGEVARGALGAQYCRRPSDESVGGARGAERTAEGVVLDLAQMLVDVGGTGL